MNWIPGVSQIKSIAQLATGNVEGALKTQRDFVRQCPVVSQTVATVQLVAGDEEGAMETFKEGASILTKGRPRKENE